MIPIFVIFNAILICQSSSKLVYNLVSYKSKTRLQKPYICLSKIMCFWSKHGLWCKNDPNLDILCILGAKTLTLTVWVLTYLK